MTLPSVFYFHHSKITQYISTAPSSDNHENYFQSLLHHNPSDINIISWKWNDIEVCEKNWAKHSKLIFAAGGIVKNKLQQILFIYRNNHWDLPKGKVEENEICSTAAIREVKEETGVDAFILEQEPKITYHLFYSKTEKIFYLKKSYWYEMFVSSLDQTLLPQNEEGIEKAVWIDKEEWKKMEKEAFLLIKDLISQLNW